MLNDKKHHRTMQWHRKRRISYYTGECTNIQIAVITIAQQWLHHHHHRLGNLPCACEHFQFMFYLTPFHRLTVRRHHRHINSNRFHSNNLQKSDFISCTIYSQYIAFFSVFFGVSLFYSLVFFKPLIFIDMIRLSFIISGASTIIIIKLQSIQIQKEQRSLCAHSTLKIMMKL